ncbi:MAG: PadR family transcriptional regulator [Candidatus Binataceae bacterium]
MRSRSLKPAPRPLPAPKPLPLWARAFAEPAPAPRIDVKFPILGFLMESEMTGYDLKRRFQDPIGFFYRVSDGSLYPALKRMALDGLVTMRSERHGRRARKVYAITAAGRARFLKTLREPAQPLFIYDESQIKIYFAEHDPQAALEHLDRAGREDAEVVKMLTWLAGEMKRRGDSPFRQIVVELGRAVCTTKVEVFAKLTAQLKREMAPARRIRSRPAAAAAAGR